LITESGKESMKHMTEKDRYFIEKALKQKMSIKKIADALGYTRAAIYYEISKGKVTQLDGHTWEKKEIYLTDAGQSVYEENQKKKGRPNKLKKDDKNINKGNKNIIWRISGH